MKIAVDVYGGDYSPKETILGALDALSQPGFDIIFFGNKEEIESIISEETFDKNRVSIFNAPDIISNNDIPTEAVRKKQNSSMIAALKYLNEEREAIGFVSSGSTGAVLTGAVLLLKRIRGINRPALCPVLPTITDKNVLLMDCGANPEPKSVNLLQYAIMANAYAKCIMGVEHPKIGLLSNGTEDKKGNTLTKEAFALLKEEQDLVFMGNIEGRDILSGQVDVVVSDGFSGNIALKSCEGTALAMFDMIKKGILSSGIRAKIGYLLLKPVFKNIKKRMDYNDNGGAVLLGLEKIVVKAHGSSKANAIKNSVLQVKTLYEKKVIENIENELAKQK